MKFIFGTTLFCLSLFLPMLNFWANGAIVTDHLAPEDSCLGGILASNLVHTRQRRTLNAITEGTRFGVKWSITFSVKTLTALGSSLQFTHFVGLPLNTIYPEKDVKERLDFNPEEYLDKDILSSLLSLSREGVERIGQVLDQKKTPAQLKMLAKTLLKQKDLSWANRTNEVFDENEIIVENLSKLLNKELQFQENMKKDRLKSRQDRLYLYKDLQSFLDKMGLPGRPCLLRSICEVGKEPFEDSLYGEPLNILMMASLGGRTEYAEEGEEYNRFVDAEMFGRDGGNCEKEFNQCSDSIFIILYHLAKDLLT